MKRLLFLAAFTFCFKLNATLFFTPQMISSHLNGYTEEEVDLIKKDLNVVRSVVCLEGTKNSEKRFFLATAGKPGARKSTILEKFVASHPEYQEGVYLDPDPRTLKFMVHTYYAKSLNHLAISETKNYELVIKNAYEKWRGGSNFIALSLLEEAFEKGKSVIHGSTSTGGHIPAFLSKLKENKYEVILLLCSCSDSVRDDAIDYRNKIVRFYQSTPQDVQEKALFFAQRMKAYFDHADQLYFYWSDSLFGEERLAATWSSGQLNIVDQNAMDLFVEKYENDRKLLSERNIDVPSFQTYLLAK